MKYDIDSNGYIKELLWGCNNGSCVEYEGEVPEGYTDIEQWADSASINAYYIDNGNLTLDSARQAELNQLNMLQAQDYEPIYYKDLTNSISEIYENYEDGYETGNPIYLDNARNSTQSVFFTNVFQNRIDFFCQTKNMMSDEAVSETISGITFTKGENGAISLSGTATEAVEYNLSGSADNTVPICGLKANKQYYLNLGGLSCEMRNKVNGTVEQVYTGTSGAITLIESKNITQIVLVIPSGSTVDQTIYPMLELGEAASEWVEHHSSYINIDLSDYEFETSQLVPSETLCPANDLYPTEYTFSIDYVYIMDGQLYVSYYGAEEFAGLCTFKLLNGYNFVYTTQSLGMELNYKIDTLQEIDEITANWCAENDRTYIDGAKIYTGSITAQQLAADSVTAEKINVTDLQALGATIGGFTIGENTLSSNNNYLTIDSLNKQITSKGDTYYTRLTTGQLAYGTWSLNSFTPYGFIGVREADDQGVASTSLGYYATQGKRSAMGYIANNIAYQAIFCDSNGTGLIARNGTSIYFGTLSNNTGGQSARMYSDTAHLVFRPTSDCEGRFGTLSYRWDAGYFRVMRSTDIIVENPPWGSSDLKKKEIIDFDKNKYIDFIRGLEPISFKFIEDEEQKSHVGFGAQDVYSMAKRLDMNDYGFTRAIKDEETISDIENYDDKELDWSMAYTEIIAPLVYTVQKLYEKVETLEEVQNERRS